MERASSNRKGVLARPSTRRHREEDEVDMGESKFAREEGGKFQSEGDPIYRGSIRGEATNGTEGGRIFGMNGYHSYWTAPSRVRGLDPQIGDFELLFMALSALTFRRSVGRMSLYTDKAGAAFLERMSVLDLYDDVSLELDKIVGVDPRVFWAAGKVYAYALCPAPCISVDLDAVLWGPLPKLVKDVRVLHEDCIWWDCYAHSRELYTKYSMGSHLWNWKATPLNVGILEFRDDKVKGAYVMASIQFMESFSAAGDSEKLRKFAKEAEKEGRKIRIFEQIFAEQQMLSMVLDRMGGKYETVSRIDGDTDHLAENPFVTHLWGAKDFYKIYPPAKDAMISYLLNRLGREYPEAARFVEKMESIYRGSGRLVEGGSGMGLARVESPGQAPALKVSARVAKVRSIEGLAWAEDLCFGFRRPLRVGSSLQKGEVVHVEGKGAACSLVLRDAKVEVLSRTEGELRIRVVKDRLRLPDWSTSGSGSS